MAERLCCSQVAAEGLELDAGGVGTEPGSAPSPRAVPAAPGAEPEPPGPRAPRSPRCPHPAARGEPGQRCHPGPRGHTAPLLPSADSAISMRVSFAFLPRRFMVAGGRSAAGSG